MNVDPFDPAVLLQHEFEDHARLIASSARDLSGPFALLVEACATALENSGKIMFFGNGGSAADAQHLAAEFVVRLTCHRVALPAMALSTDTSVLTAIGNDYGFERIFERQIEALARASDIAIGISTSGNSPNVLKGLEMARRRGCKTVGLSGGTGGRMSEVADILLQVPSATTARIQEIHILVGHALCRAIELRLRLQAV